MEISLRELAEAFQGPQQPEPDYLGPWKIDHWYLIRTVTMTLTGKLVFIGHDELVLTDAAWIADTGRFHDCLKDPTKINEAEPFVNDCIVGRGSIVDATEWHAVKVPQK